MAKLVDAQDLKSCGSQIPCRFKSGLRHHLFFWRNTQVGWRDWSWKPAGRASGARVRIPIPPPFKIYIAGWSSLVARRAHNPKVVGSNPSPATMVPWCSGYHVCLSRRRSRVQVPSEPPFFYFGSVAQSVEQGTENPCVDGSIPFGATIVIN